MHSNRSKPDASLPWVPSYRLDTEEGRFQHAQDCKALQLLAAGECPPHLQKRALEMIIYKLCGTYDMEFRPGGEDGRRASDFAGGKRWVGTQIVTMLRVNTAALVRGAKGEPKEQG